MKITATSVNIPGPAPHPLDLVIGDIERYYAGDQHYFVTPEHLRRVWLAFVAYATKFKSDPDPTVTYAIEMLNGIRTATGRLRKDATSNLTALEAFLKPDDTAPCVREDALIEHLRARARLDSTAPRMRIFITYIADCLSGAASRHGRSQLTNFEKFYDWMARQHYSELMGRFKTVRTRRPQSYQVFARKLFPKEQKPPPPSTLALEVIRTSGYYPEIGHHTGMRTRLWVKRRR